MYLSYEWLLLIIVSTVIGGATQSYIKSTFRKWSQVPTATGMTGAEVARRVLDAAGLNAVPVNPVAGSLTDHYDPRNRTIALSQSVFAEGSVAAAGVAAHEAGHAIQHQQGYIWGNVHTAIVPAANIGSRLAFPMILLGIFLNIGGLSTLGVVLFGGAVLFHVVTLPVEFDASRRALVALTDSGALPPEQVGGARQVLSAAALTYVAAALIAVLQLIYFFGLSRRN